MVNTTEHCNETTCVRSDQEPNLGIAVTSAVILSATTFIGTISNAAALHKLTKKNWRHHYSIIQLLYTGLIVCCVLAPIQIIRISLSFTAYRLQEICFIHHFLHLHVDSCTFVTVVMISYERLMKICNSFSYKIRMTFRKVILYCSWLVVLPFAIYIIYHENKTPSVFSYDCILDTGLDPPHHSVQIIYAVLFMLTLVVMTTMYFLAVCSMWNKISNRVDNRSSNLQFHSVTPVTVLEPREATGINIGRADSDGADMSNEERLIGLRKISDTFLQQSREKAKSSIANALGQISNISLFSFDEELERRYESYLNPLKHTRRSAGNVWHEEAVTSNILKNTRQSAGNVRHEEVVTPNKSLNLMPQPIRKKKKMPKIHGKLKKQYSSDSIGTFSDTSGFTDFKTDSDISSITYNTESVFSVLDEGSSNISVIIEQPEPETVSQNSRRPSFSNSRKPSSCNSRRPSSSISRQPSSGNSRRPSSSISRQPSSGNSRRPSSSVSKHLSSEKKPRITSDSRLYVKPNIIEPRQEDSGGQFSPVEMRPRCYSATFRPAIKEAFPPVDEFRKRAYTDSSKSKPKNLPDKNRIRQLRSRKIKKRKSKVLPPIRKPSPNNLSCEIKSKFYSSTDDSCQEQDKERSKSKPNTLTLYSSSEELDWSDCSLSNYSGFSSSIYNFNAPSTLMKPKTNEPKLVDSMTQTEENIMVIKTDCKDLEQTNHFPIIRIIGPNVKKSDTLMRSNSVRNDPTNGQQHQLWIPQNHPIRRYDRNPHRPNNWFSDTESRSVSQLSPNGRAWTSQSMTSLRTRRSDMGTMIKRSALIIISLALSYLPGCISVMVLDNMSIQQGQCLLQISRSIQYLYFSIIPVIYVYTNQGLMKMLKRNTPRS